MAAGALPSLGMPRLINLANLQQFQAVNLLSDPGSIAGPVRIPSCAQVAIGFSLPNSKQANLVLYGRYSGAFATTPAQAASALTALTSGANWTALAAFMPNTASLNSIKIHDVNTVNNVIISAGGGAAGTSVSAALPDEVALVVTLRTARTGPSGRGRFYFPAFATNALGTAGVAIAGVVAALDTWASSNIPSAMAALSYQHVLGLRERAAYTSAVTGRVFPARAATSEIITAYDTNNHWDTQRKRGLR